MPIVSYHGDKPGMVGLTGQLLAIILILHQCRWQEIKGGQTMMVLSIDQPVTEDIINELYDVGGFDKIYGTTLQSNN